MDDLGGNPRIAEGLGLKTQFERSELEDGTPQYTANLSDPIPQDAALETMDHDLGLIATRRQSLQVELAELKELERGTLRAPIDSGTISLRGLARHFDINSGLLHRRLNPESEERHRKGARKQSAQDRTDAQKLRALRAIDTED